VTSAGISMHLELLEHVGGQRRLEVVVEDGDGLADTSRSR
jgi:hypothetical protein